MLAVAATAALASAQEQVDLSVVYRIKAEATENSKVMDHAFWLTDVYGPRLTNTPMYRKSAEWAAQRLTEYGLQNVKLETWGPYGRAWSVKRFSANMVEPQFAPLLAYPLALSGATTGSITGEPIYTPIRNEADLAKYKGTLKGKIVMVDATRDLSLVDKPLSSRYQATDLTALEAMAEAAAPRENPYGVDASGNPRTRESYTKWRDSVRKFLTDEGVQLIVQASRGAGGLVFAQSYGGREAKDVIPPPAIVVAPEQYNRMVRLLDHKVPVKIECSIDSTNADTAVDSVNVVGEIPGTTKKDEVIMLGAHLDSWHSGTGATDNAAGVAVIMEAVRILEALKLPLKRTVRVGLWGGEEEGLLGSKAYVKQHFADPAVMKPSAEHAKLSGYFNLDNGSGKIRGVYLQQNDMMRPLFEAWLAPFKDMGVTTISIRNTGGTDHLSFDKVGLPGFQFIQDPLEYETRTHHSNLDVYDRLQKSDLMQAATVMASVIYDAANREAMLPRKPLPKPEKPAAKPDEKPLSQNGAPATAHSPTF